MQQWFNSICMYYMQNCKSLRSQNFDPTPRDKECLGVIWKTSREDGRLERRLREIRKDGRRKKIKNDKKLLYIHIIMLSSHHQERMMYRLAKTVPHF